MSIRIIVYPIFLLLVSATYALPVWAQKQAANWFFGNKAGLKFTESGVVYTSEGALTQFEGCSSISDDSGNLLFYTDGVTVYNRLHQPMPNGIGLLGSSTSTQTLIVQKPSSESIFFIFTCLANFDTIDPDSTGFRYSIVDMSLDYGLGDVTTKNQILFTNTTEKITAVHHQNGKDTWVVSHEYGNNTFRSYLINESGIVFTPNISRLGTPHANTPNLENVAGAMKLSPDGSKIALVLYQPRIIELFSFDSSSGAISRLIRSITVNSATGSFYGIEFSPDGTFVYFTITPGSCGFNDTENPGMLFQYSLNSDRTTLLSSYAGSYGALQCGLDGKIYVSRCNDIIGESDYVGVINYPHREGVECGFQPEGVHLGAGTCALGLPGFVQSNFLFEDPQIEMPNVFSPNGDQYNPVFRPITVEEVLEGRLLIINRWGQSIFQSDDLTDGWNGGDASPGTYYWQVIYEGRNGKRGVAKGWVQLLR